MKNFQQSVILFLIAFNGKKKPHSGGIAVRLGGGGNEDYSGDLNVHPFPDARLQDL
jgi:hypothetical protein